MPWCLLVTGASGQAHPRSQGLLLGQGSMACPLATHRCTRLSLTLILHVLGPVSSAISVAMIVNSLIFIFIQFVQFTLHFTLEKRNLSVLCLSVDMYHKLGDIVSRLSILNFFLCVFCSGSQVMPTSMPPPRKLPQRPWAASIPTILTHSALHVLLLPSPTPSLVPGLAGSYLCSPLERFLGSVIMRRHLQRIIQQEANVSFTQNIQKVLVCYCPLKITYLLSLLCHLYCSYRL